MTADRFATIEISLKKLEEKLLTPKVVPAPVAEPAVTKFDNPVFEPKKEDLSAVKVEIPEELAVVRIMQEFIAIAKKLQEVALKDPRKCLWAVDNHELVNILLSTLSLIQQHALVSIKSLKKIRSACYRCWTLVD